MHSAAEGVLQQSPRYLGAYTFLKQMPNFKSSAINLVMYMEWWVLLKLSQCHTSHHAQLRRECLPLHLTGVKLRECRPIQDTRFSHRRTL